MQRLKVLRQEESREREVKGEGRPEAARWGGGRWGDIAEKIRQMEDWGEELRMALEISRRMNISQSSSMSL